jgi:hypothetical protein
MAFYGQSGFSFINALANSCEASTSGGDEVHVTQSKSMLHIYQWSHVHVEGLKELRDRKRVEQLRLRSGDCLAPAEMLLTWLFKAHILIKHNSIRFISLSYNGSTGANAFTPQRSCHSCSPQSYKPVHCGILWRHIHHQIIASSSRTARLEPRRANRV